MSEPTLKSPVSGETMVHVILGNGLQAHRCPQSGGHYITSQAYMHWLQQQPARLAHLPAANDAPPAREEHDGVLFCPETGTLMTRWKIGHGFSFAIDRSITGGIWLDCGEWEALEARNFHDEIHLVFTAPWQKQIRSAHSQETYLGTLEETLGADLLSQVSALREALQNHPHRSMALAYLQA